eukprot:scaffold9208_cov98-Isochrysis_galbana.AAC.10
MECASSSVALPSAVGGRRRVRTCARLMKSPTSASAANSSALRCESSPKMMALTGRCTPSCPSPLGAWLRVVSAAVKNTSRPEIASSTSAGPTRDTVRRKFPGSQTKSATEARSLASA